MRRRIGIFGGSFDPIHLGHLIMAEMFWESMRLESVLVLPAQVSPFKTDSHPTADKHRLEMLRLAIGGNPHLLCDDREVQRGGVSYTVDTLRSLRNEMPDADLFLLIGADSVRDFDKWREPQEVLSLAQLVVVDRGGVEVVSWEALELVATEEQLQTIRSLKIDAPKIEIASSDIRQRVRDGRSVRYLVPAAVEAYIEEHRLWRE